MKPDISAPIHTPDERTWVEAELVRMALRNSRGSLVAVPPLVLLLVVVLWGDADQLALLSWAAAALATAGMRGAVLHHHERRMRGAGNDALLAWYERVRHVWTAGALAWGVVVGLFFERVPLSSQFLCWLALVGVGMYTANALSPVLQTLRAYLNALVLSALALVTWRAVVTLGLNGPYYHYWLMALLVIYWQVLQQSGRRAHATHRRNLELQYRNSQLINSLTRQTQAALDAIEAKNRFLASATHDIRQPVHALGLYADWLASEPEMVRELAPKIVESTKAVNTLFDSLFDVVRLDAGGVKLKVEDLPLKQLLGELEVQYRPVAQAKGLRMRVRVGAGGAADAAHSDALLLKRVVGNLLSNAIKYTERGGLLLAARRRAGKPCIEVWDTGVGIAPAHQRDIFREFYKVPIHSGTEDGFGLGLYIVQRLAHILGHPVEFRSRVGRGTMFRVVLEPVEPLAAAQRAAALDQLASRP